MALGRPTAGVGVHREGPEPREHPEEPRRLSSQRPGACAGTEGVAGDLGLCRQDQAALSPADRVKENAMETLKNMYCYHDYQMHPCPLLPSDIQYEHHKLLF